MMVISDHMAKMYCAFGVFSPKLISELKPFISRFIFYLVIISFHSTPAQNKLYNEHQHQLSTREWKVKVKAIKNKLWGRVTGRKWRNWEVVVVLFPPLHSNSNSFPFSSGWGFGSAPSRRSSIVANDDWLTELSFDNMFSLKYSVSIFCCIIIITFIICGPLRQRKRGKGKGKELQHALFRLLLLLEPYISWFWWDVKL